MSTRSSEYRDSSGSNTDRSSTTSISTARSSYISQEYGKQSRRSNYRLFPIVEPTPPTSPVAPCHPPRKSSASGPSRQRSISLEPYNRASHRELFHLAPQASPHDPRRPSTPDLRSQGTAEESDQAESAAQRLGPIPSTPRTFNARDAFTRSQRALRQSSRDLALEEETIGSTPLTASLSVPVDSGLGSSPARGRAKSKPNLRIAVANTRSTDASLAISFPSPGRSRAASARRSTDKPLSPPASPVAAPTREAPGPPAAGRSGGSAPIVTGGNSRRPKNRPLVAHAGPARSPSTRGRPESVSNVSDSDSQIVSRLSALPAILTAGLKPPAFRKSVRASSLPAPNQEAMSRENGRASKPQVANTDTLSPPDNSTASDLPSLDSKFAPRRAVTPDPFVEEASKVTLKVDRPFTAYGTANGRLAVSRAPDMPGRSLTEAPDSPVWRADNAALAAARANVAALSAAPSVRSFSLSDVTSMNGTAPHKASGRRDDLNPSRILDHLNQESEALHAKQANLRAERQRISANIITTLQAPQTTPEYFDQVLNEQLQLVAINSSMDICWAKMKSLECRREDAVAALISQTSLGQIGDGNTTTLATLALGSGKPSYPVSVDSNYQPGSTNGRSTPDMPANDRHNLAPSNKKYFHSSDADSQDSHLSARFRKIYSNEKYGSQSTPVETTLSLVDEVGTEEETPASACLSPDTDLEDMFNTADNDIPKTVQVVAQEEQEAARTDATSSGGFLGSRLFDLRGVKSRESPLHKKSGTFEKLDSPKRADSPVPQTTAQSTRPLAPNSNPRLATSQTNTKALPTHFSALTSHPLTPKVPGQESTCADEPALNMERPIVQLQLPRFDTIKPSKVRANEPVSMSVPTPEGKPEIIPAPTNLTTSTTLPAVPITIDLPTIPSARLSFGADFSLGHSLDLQLSSFPSAPIHSGPTAAPARPASSIPAAESHRPPRTSSMMPISRIPPPAQDAGATFQKEEQKEARVAEDETRMETKLHARAIRKLMAQQGWT